VDGNFPQKAAQEAGAGNAGIFIKYRKKGTPAMEKEGGNFFIPSGQKPYVPLAFTKEKKTGAGGNTDLFALPEKIFRSVMLAPGYPPPTPGLV